MSPSLDQFFQKHFPIIRAKCARMLGDTDEAADVAQEAFVRLWGSPVAQEPAAARARWIYKTSTHLAIDRLRRVRRGVELRIPADAPAGSMESAVNARSWLAQLAQRVPADELEVLILSRIDGMTHDEIAQVINRSARTVRRMTSAAEARLEALKGSFA